MMKRSALMVFAVLMLAFGAHAQDPAGSSEPAPTRRIFRATKDQISQVQTKLKAANLYAGETTGKLDSATRKAIKDWQAPNGLKQTGTLNRATLEKMNIELTDSQKLIPVSEGSYASSDDSPKKAKGDKPAKLKPDNAASGSADTKPKRVIFRATKEQITAAQAKLRDGKHYDGEATGKLDTATRASLKKYQEASGLKATGTLNQVTLEKMGIELTDKQKAASATSN